MRIIGFMSTRQTSITVFMALACQINQLPNAFAFIALSGYALVRGLADAAIIQLLFKIRDIFA
jgi:hypothetical protein